MGDIMWNPLERSLHLIRVLLYWGLSFDISNICESISSLIQGIAYQDFYVLCLIPTNVTQGTGKSLRQSILQHLESLFLSKKEFD